MFSILFVLLFVNLSCSLGNIEKFHNSTETILCRICGSELLTSDKIIAKLSSSAQYSFKDTLFNRDEVLVQVLSKNIFFQFPLITSSHATCISKEEFEEDESWFSDYSWKPCFCPECGMLIGWMFEHDSQKIISSHEKFFGLILPHLISENFTNFLIEYPGGLL